MNRYFSIFIIALLFIPNELFAQVKAGDEAPGFTYTSLENEEISLSDYSGKVVFLFLFGADCPHCKQNGPGTEEKIYQEFKSDTNFSALGLEIWNLNASTVNSFKNTTGITYPLLLNAQQSSYDYYGSYTYDRSVVVDSEGKIAYIGTANLEPDEIDRTVDAIKDALSMVDTSSDNLGSTPSRIVLHQNYPNPFNPSTVISYSLNKPTHVSLKVYNILGAEVATLVDEQQSTGKKSIRWSSQTNSGAALPSGIYIYQLKAGDQLLTKKMTLIK